MTDKIYDGGLRMLGFCVGLLGLLFALHVALSFL